MVRKLSYSVSDQDVGMRLDALAAARGLYESRSLAERFIEEGRVLINGNPSQKKYRIQPNDFIVYEAAETPLRAKPIGEPIPLDIRYEDEFLIVLSKQPGLVCHPAPDHADGTLVNALIYQYGIEGLCNVQGDNDRLGIVHRLDCDTSGLMMAAKRNEAGEYLMEAIRNREVDRRYLALVRGNIAHDSGMVDAPIARSTNDRTRMSVREGRSSRSSITTFKVLERFEDSLRDDGYTLLECKLFTGRTHQIRVHMNYIKHPVVGDPMYGGGSPASQLGLDRQFLHSYKLSFLHPLSKKSMVFEDSLPPDLDAALRSIRTRSLGRTEKGEEVLGPIDGLQTEKQTENTGPEETVSP